MRSLNVTAVIIALGAILIDQLSKIFIIKEIPANGIFLFQTNFFSFQLLPLLNRNIAFGIPLPGIIIALILIALIWLIAFLITKELAQKNAWGTLTLSLVLAGALSNIIDRIFRTGVVDFLAISIYNFNWPTFNLADATIVVGLIIYLIKQPKKMI